MANARPEFAPSPRPLLPLSTLATCICRDHLALAACFRRAENSTRTYYRIRDNRCWRWLFMPAKPPLVDEDARP
jgi:hypothetical protein